MNIGHGDLQRKLTDFAFVGDTGLSLADQTDVSTGATHINANGVRIAGELAHCTCPNRASGGAGQGEVHGQPSRRLRAADAAVGLHDEEWAPDAVALC